MGSGWVGYNSQMNLGWVQVGQVRIDRWGGQDGLRLDWLKQLGRARIGWFEQLDGVKWDSGWVCQNRLMEIGQFQVGQVRIVRWSQDGFRLGRLEQLDGARLSRLEQLDGARMGGQNSQMELGWEARIVRWNQDGRLEQLDRARMGWVNLQPTPLWTKEDYCLTTNQSYKN